MEQLMQDMEKFGAMEQHFIGQEIMDLWNEYQFVPTKDYMMWSNEYQADVDVETWITDFCDNTLDLPCTNKYGVTYGILVYIGH